MVQYLTVYFQSLAQIFQQVLSIEHDSFEDQAHDFIKSIFVLQFLFLDDKQFHVK